MARNLNALKRSKSITVDVARDERGDWVLSAGRYRAVVRANCDEVDLIDSVPERISKLAQRIASPPKRVAPLDPSTRCRQRLAPISPDSPRARLDRWIDKHRDVTPPELSTEQRMEIDRQLAIARAERAHLRSH